MQKQETNDQELVTLSVRVTRETAEGLKRVAEASYRPVAAEMRRLIETRVAEHVAELKEVA